MNSPRRRWSALVAVALVATANCRDVSITAVDAARIEIDPSDAVVQVDQTTRLTARVLSRDGEQLSGRPIEWTSMHPEFATVDQSGNVHGVAVGAATIRASSEGVDGTAEVSVTPGPAIELVPANVEFVGVQNGATPGDRTIAVTNSGAGNLAGLAAEVAYATGEPAGWLAAVLAPTTAPASLVLGADQTGLAPGAYHATVAVTAPGASNSPAAVNVTLTVLSPQPAISLGSTSVSFSTPAGGANPGQQTVSITNAGGGTLSGLTASVTYTAGQPTGWLNAAVGSTAPASLVLQATLGSLPGGVYTASVRIASPVAQNSPQTVTVTFTVGAALPAISVAPADIDFAAVRGGTNPTPVDVAITNAGGATLTDLAISVEYLGGQPGGWLSPDLSATTAPATLRIATAIGALASGTYTATVRVSSPAAANSPQSVNVTLVVDDAPPTIAASPASLSFTMTTSQPDPAAQQVAVTNSGGGTLSGLSANPVHPAGEPDGWLAAALDRTTAPASLTVSVARGSLTVGTYTAAVRIAAAGAANTPLDVVVTFTLSDEQPATPSALSATAVSERRIDLAWTDNSDNEAEFAIERSVSGGNWSEVDRTGSGIATYVDSTGVAPSTDYLYRIRACNAAGCSDASVPASATSGPAAPSGVDAASLPPTSIELSWTDNSADETGFRIERSIDGTTWGTLHTTGADATTHTDATGTPQTTYHYRVRACRSTLCSTPTASASASTGAALPDAPSSLNASVVSATQIDLSWAASSGTIVEYRIERRTGSGSYAEIATVSAASTSYQNSGLTPQTSYTYRVRACNTSGCSNFSGEASAMTLPQPPGAPSGLTATTVSASQIDLAWSAASGTVGDYRVERKEGAAGTYTLIATVPGDTPSYQDSGLSPGTPYTYRVSACNVGGCSGFSGEASATTHPADPNAPSSLNATTVSASRIDLAWVAAAGDVTRYRIERRTGSGAFAAVDSVAGGVLSYQNTGLAAGTQYTYRVQACNAGGCSAYSNEASASTLPNPPGVPSNVNATTASPTQIDLSWSASSGTVTEYRIERKSGAGAYAEIDAVSGSTQSYEDTGLTPGTGYTYQIRACNAGGCSAYSAEASATTHPAAPGAPANLTAATVSSSQIHLAWDGSAGATEYRVERRRGPGAFAQIAALSQEARSFESTGLAPDTTYTFRIRACNAGGCSSYSNQASATTHPLPPGAPSGLSASMVSSTQIDLGWNAASGTVGEYRIERKTGAGGTYAQIATVPDGTLEYENTGLTANTEYRYRVRACNVSGCSPFSGEAVARTNAQPAVSITAPANGASFAAGTSVSFTGTASDPEDGSLSAEIAWSSSRDGSLGTGASVTTSTLREGTHTITASVTDADGSSASASISITIRSNTVPDVTITAPTNGTTVTEGTSVSFTGSATDAEDGSLTSSLAWSSSRDGSIGSGGSFAVSDLSVGAHTITASVTDSDGNPASESITLTIAANAQPTVSITAPANGASFAAGTSVSFTGSASDTEDGSLSAEIAWSSSRDGSLGTGASVTTSTLSEGTHTITASVTDNHGSSASASISITIRSNTVPDVTITAPTNGTTVTEGTSVSFTGSATDAEDGSLTSSLAWSSNLDGSIGTGGSFAVSDLSVGAHTITAAVTDSDGNPASESITLTIAANAQPTVSITAPANGASFAAGTSVSFTGTASDTEDGSMSGEIAWSSSRDGSLGTGASVTTSTLSEGTHTITASVTDNHGSSASASISITIRSNTPPDVTLSAPASGTTVTEGTTVSFAGSATDAEDGSLNSSLAWSSSIDGSIGSGGSFGYDALSVGTHTITASVTDSDGNPASESITLTIAANVQPSVSITAPANGASFAARTSVSFTGTASDPEDGGLSAEIAWSSSRDGSFGTGASVTTSTLSEGVHTITASVTDSHGSSADASINITIRSNTAPQVAITAPVSGTTVTEGASVTFTGSASDAEDGDLTSSLAWTSDLDESIGSGGSFAVSDLSVGTHTITASVTDSDGNPASSSITLTIQVAAPGAPTNLSATGISPSRIDLSWSAASGTVDEYRIERKTGSGGTYAQIGTVGGGTLVYSDTVGLTTDTEYFYRVRACNTTDCSGYSNEDSAATSGG